MFHRAVPILVARQFVLGAALAVAADQPAPAAPAGASPHITFDAKDVNLGDVIHGQDAVATFTYHNTGSAPLHILSAKPG
jgi:hypothetical protein